jgi:hypothetical protein
VVVATRKEAAMVVEVAEAAMVDQKTTSEEDLEKNLEETLCGIIHSRMAGRHIGGILTNVDPMTENLI